MKGKWLLKIKRYDGSESVLDSYTYLDDAEQEMQYLNEAYQTSEAQSAGYYYVERYDPARLVWPSI